MWPGDRLVFTTSMFFLHSNVSFHQLGTISFRGRNVSLSFLTYRKVSPLNSVQAPHGMADKSNCFASE